mgnify:CR=1 FL=1
MLLGVASGSYNVLYMKTQLMPSSLDSGVSMYVRYGYMGQWNM